jgi:hypothetical protein
MRRLVALFLIAIFLVSCSSPISASVFVTVPTNNLSEFCPLYEIDTFRGQFMPLLQNYYDQVQAISSATKESMANELEKLKDIGKKVGNLSTNACTSKPQSSLVNAINSSLDGFQAILSGQSKSIQVSFFDEGTQFIRDINLEVARLAACGTNCTHCSISG